MDFKRGSAGCDGKVCPVCLGRSNMYGWDWGSRLPDAGMWRDVIWKILLPICFRVWISALSLPGNSENFYGRIG
ncbi:MAG: hypothetical protein ACLT5W_09610 [Ruminococcus sp.]